MEIVSMLQNKRTLLWIGLAIFGSVFVFFGFHLLYASNISDYGREFVAGCLGALITIAATAALLKSQTEGEVAKEQLTGIFHEKLKVYSEFISFLNKIHEDGVVDSQEITKLIEWACNLSLICRPGIIRKIYEYAFQVVAFGVFKYDELSDENKIKWKKWVVELYEDDLEGLDDEVVCEGFFSSVPLLISYLRDDLAHRKMSDFDENLNIQIILGELLDLHAVQSIEISGDDIEITKLYPKPKRARKPRATAS